MDKENSKALVKPIKVYAVFWMEKLVFQVGPNSLKTSQKIRRKECP
jgi:hypothetical protein